MNKIVKDDVVIFEIIGTGLGKSSEVLEVAIVDLSGTVLYHSLVKAKGRISARASEVHGIRRTMIQGSPSFTEVWEQIKAILTRKAVLTGQENHTMRLLQNSFSVWDIPTDEVTFIPEMQSVLTDYADAVGSKKVLKLESLAPGPFDHRAISRASAVRFIWHKYIQQLSEVITDRVVIGSEKEISHDVERTTFYDATCDKVLSDPNRVQIQSDSPTNGSLQQKVKKWWERLNQFLRNQIK